MRKLAFTIGIAAAIALPGANAAVGSEAVGPPYEELQVDRSLPNIPERAVAPDKRISGSPYEELDLERALPQFPERMPNVPERPGAGEAASSGSTFPGSTWDKDHNFVAPAQ